MAAQNLDPDVVRGFGEEWARYDQRQLADADARRQFDAYFRIFPWNTLPERAEGFDLGCGSGRWAKLVAPRVAMLHCIDPSSALDVARSALKEYSNCAGHSASVDQM